MRPLWGLTKSDNRKAIFAQWQHPSQLLVQLNEGKGQSISDVNLIFQYGAIQQLCKQNFEHFLPPNYLALVNNLSK